MLTTALIGIISQNPARAATSVTNSVSLTVLSACSISSSTDTFSSTIQPGSSGQIGSTKSLTITCNNPSGYSLYAIGFSNNDEPGTTELVGTKQGNAIKTGTATSGDTSNWNFKLANPSTGLSIASGFDAAHTIPTSSTLIASRSSGGTSASGDTVDVSYSIYISALQPADTYSGKVNYTLFQPATSVERTMQNFSCDTLTEGQITSLIDSRDGNPYQVAKLKDGKCWMIQNLRLGNKDKAINLTSADSDVSVDFSLPISKASGFTGANNRAAYVNSEYGGYYSWFTATAGTGTSTMTTKGENATSSICPKGWRLPTGGSGSEIQTMMQQYGSGTDEATAIALQATPIPGFVLSGSFNSSSSTNQGTVGRYWSSTVFGKDLAYGLGFDASSASAGNYGRHFGFAVRCVAR